MTAIESRDADADSDADTSGPPARSRLKIAVARGLTVLAVLVVWFALVAPNEFNRLTPTAFIRIPIEGLVLVVAALVLPRRARQVTAIVVGALLGVLTLLKILDMGFFETLGRPFHPAIDWTYFGSAEGVLGDSIGSSAAIVVVVVTLILAVAVLILMPLSVLRLMRLVERHRTRSVRAVTAGGAVWILCAVSGLQLVPGAPIASTSAAGLAWGQVRQVSRDLRDANSFTQALSADPVGDTPANRLLTGLRGKDVIVAFVESYGKVAVQGSKFSPGVDAVLDAGTSRLRAAGFGTRSAFLTSPTFGGISWLAHSTLQSGLWVDNQLRYNDLISSQRFTLTAAFKRAGWRTVSDVPSDTRPWPEGKRFYSFDKLYNRQNVGYAGPKFSYAAMPDQYTLSTFEHRELDKPHRAPVMAEIDLVSSHAPWTPLPHMIAWNAVGDGSVYKGMPAQGQPPSAVWPDAGKVQTVYGQSIEYSLSSLISFVQTTNDKNLVLVMLGDHQPATIVSGPGASHDVPVSIIAHDPAVLDRISGWGWQDGLLPKPNAPVWRMDAFRDRFLTAYGPERSPPAPH